jgi:hypothetical protein
MAAQHQCPHKVSTVVIPFGDEKWLVGDDERGEVTIFTFG